MTDRCVIDGCANETDGHICRLHWFMLPLSLRQWWWRRTDYSRTAPTIGLRRVVRKEIAFVES